MEPEEDTDLYVVHPSAPSRDEALHLKAQGFRRGRLVGSCRRRRPLQRLVYAGRCCSVIRREHAVSAAGSRGRGSLNPAEAAALP